MGYACNKQHQLLQLEIDFKYHKPQDGDFQKFVAIRDAGHTMAATIIELTPTATPEQLEALKKVQEAVMWANAALSRREANNKLRNRAVPAITDFGNRG